MVPRFKALMEKARQSLTNSRQSGGISNSIRAYHRIILGLAGLWLIGIGFQAINPGHMSDFNSYYYGTKAAFEGLNPYDYKNVALMKGTAVESHIHFSYPPYMLALFSPVLLGSFDAARLGFLLIKLIVAFGLIVLWLKGFRLNRASDPFFLLILVVGAFHGAFQTDILAGNVSIFEQLFLWTGIAFFFRNKPHLSMIGIVLAGLVKGPLILLLFVLLIRPDDKHLHAFLYGGVLFLTVVIGTFLCFPELWIQFLEKPNVIDSAGFTNPSLLAWSIFEFGPMVSSLFGIVVEPKHLYQGLALILGSIGFVSYVAIIKKTDEKIKVAFVCLMVGILLPRMKDYSFILQILPALFILANVSVSKRWLVCALLSISIWPYYHLFTQIGLLAVCIVTAWRHESPSNYPESSTFRQLTKQNIPHGLSTE